MKEKASMLEVGFLIWIIACTIQVTALRMKVANLEEQRATQCCEQCATKNPREG